LPAQISNGEHSGYGNNEAVPTVTSANSSIRTESWQNL
jgi:hypothetical protein